VQFIFGGEVWVECVGVGVGVMVGVWVVGLLPLPLRGCAR
jgi:hypothetical protein